MLVTFRSKEFGALSIALNIPKLTIRNTITTKFQKLWYIPSEIVTANIPTNRIQIRNIAGISKFRTMTNQQNWLTDKIRKGIDK